jgi:hypothetical protein
MKNNQEYNQSYYKNNKEKIKQKQKELREKNIEKYKERDKLYREKNIEKCKERDKSYYENNKERLKQQSLEHYNNNKEQYKFLFKERYVNETEEQREKRKKSMYSHVDRNRDEWNKKSLEYYYNNKEERLKYGKQYVKEKYQNDILYKLRVIISSTISRRLKKVTDKKSKSSLEMVGLDNWNTLKEYIENQWGEGMTWDNYGNKPGDWSIDHIIPISSAKTEEEIYKLNHYTNLRPMWHIDNIKKGNKF